MQENVSLVSHHQVVENAKMESWEVPHVSQLHSWDCGLACVLMALNTIGINNCSIQALAELCSTTSIWTVDLAYLLQKFSVRFSYFTVTLGANPNYSAETFYKEQLPTDLVRVDRLFQKAREKGINIQCRSINEKEISLFILSGKYIAVALVDQYKLSRSWVEDVILSGLKDSKSSYTGHYVVICGYDANADEFEIRDPASSRISERISSKCLEEARKSFGTDEDLLLISLEKSNEQQNSSSGQYFPLCKLLDLKIILDAGGSVLFCYVLFFPQVWLMVDGPVGHFQLLSGLLPFHRTKF
ncbi:Protein C22orf13, putative [Ricinus communis]|uniref:Protein C22orf13, putative n=1 Tax=Ricinus communis TaxID=3988 RepID=B9SE40_RICCO|nr:Protein C22orf13, putative [Ricinus communis]